MKLTILISVVSLLFGNVGILVPDNDKNLIISYAKMLGKALPLIVRESTNIPFLKMLYVSPSPIYRSVRSVSGHCVTAILPYSQCIFCHCEN